MDDSFCDSETAFLNMLKVDSRIDVLKTQIKFQPKKRGEKFYVNYSLKSDKVINKNERYFLFKLERADNNRVEEFVELTRKLKKIIEKIDAGNVKINTLVDDISQKYAKEAYPIINDLENLMRKLISQFMLINVGMNWSKNAMNTEIRSKIDNKKGDSNMYYDDIYMTDFIHLSDILFKKYRSVKVDEVDKLLGKSKSKDDLPYETLLKFQPLSNWERYFSEVINFSEDKLKDHWRKLYIFRNKVAHNRGLLINELDEIKKMSNKVTEVFEKAIMSLEKLNIKDEEKEIITQQKEEIVSSWGGFRNYLIHSWINPTKKDTADPIHVFHQFNPDKEEYFIERVLDSYKDNPEGVFIKLEELKNGSNDGLIDQIIFELKKRMK